MNVLRGILILVIAGLMSLLFGGTAAAQQLSVGGGQLKVEARVLPTHTILVDGEGAIVWVASNTEGNDATLRVYRNQIAAGTEQPLTGEIMDSYRQLIAAGSSRIGILYDRASFRTLLDVPDTSPLALFSVPKATASIAAQP
jgi:hypothetical protein